MRLHLPTTKFGGMCNFPPDKVSFSYNVMYNAFKRLSQPYSPAERAALFHDTAAKVYRIDV